MWLRLHSTSGLGSGDRRFLARASLDGLSTCKSRTLFRNQNMFTETAKTSMHTIQCFIALAWNYCPLFHLLALSTQKQILHYVIALAWKLLLSITSILHEKKSVILGKTVVTLSPQTHWTHFLHIHKIFLLTFSKRRQPIKQRHVAMTVL